MPTRSSGAEQKSRRALSIYRKAPINLPPAQPSTTRSSARRNGAGAKSRPEADQRNAALWPLLQTGSIRIEKGLRIFAPLLVDTTINSRARPGALNISLRQLRYRSQQVGHSTCTDPTTSTKASGRNNPCVMENIKAVPDTVVFAVVNYKIAAPAISAKDMLANARQYRRDAHWLWKKRVLAVAWNLGEVFPEYSHPLGIICTTTMNDGHRRDPFPGDANTHLSAKALQNRRKPGAIFSLTGGAAQKNTRTRRHTTP